MGGHVRYFVHSNQAGHPAERGGRELSREARQ